MRFSHLHARQIRTRLTSQARLEFLESRRLLSVTLGANLIVNPGAESNTGSSTGNDIITPSGWTASGAGHSTVVKYGAPGFPTSATPGPSSRGLNFFAGGPQGESDLFQTIDVSSIGGQIDLNNIKFSLSAFLGGLGSQTDNASIFANFQNGTGGFLSQAVAGPVTAANRGNTTELLSRTTNGTLPVGTRKIQVQLHFEVPDNTYNDGFADNASLVLTTINNNGKVSGMVFNDANGNGALSPGEVGLGGVKVFIDKNLNGIADSGEPSATTSSTGTYTISNIPAGSYSLRQTILPTFRTTTANPQTVNVSPLTTTANKNFGQTQTVVISGNVFNDANANKIKDSTEKGIAGVVVYLDFNNNGQLDSFELKSTTDANGNYKFIVPFGTYVVRQVVPAGRTQTTPTSSFNLTLAKGQTATGKNFGDK